MWIVNRWKTIPVYIARPEEKGVFSPPHLPPSPPPLAHFVQTVPHRCYPSTALGQRQVPEHPVLF